MEKWQHHLQAITSQLKNKGTIGRKGIQITANRPKTRGGYKVEKKKGLMMDKCAKCWVKTIFENGAKRWD
jgi:hypothetical protein